MGRHICKKASAKRGWARQAEEKSVENQPTHDEQISTLREGRGCSHWRTAGTSDNLLTLLAKWVLWFSISTSLDSLRLRLPGCSWQASAIARG